MIFQLPHLSPNCQKPIMSQEHRRTPKPDQEYALQKENFTLSNFKKIVKVCKLERLCFDTPNRALPEETFPSRD